MLYVDKDMSNLRDIQFHPGRCNVCSDCEDD